MTWVQHAGRHVHTCEHVCGRALACVPAVIAYVWVGRLPAPAKVVWDVK